MCVRGAHLAGQGHLYPKGGVVGCGHRVWAHQIQLPWGPGSYMSPLPGAGLAEVGESHPLCAPCPHEELGAGDWWSFTPLLGPSLCTLPLPPYTFPAGPRSPAWGGLNRCLGKVGTLEGLHRPVEGVETGCGLCPWALKGEWRSQAASVRKEALAGFEAEASWKDPLQEPVRGLLGEPGQGLSWRWGDKHLESSGC